MKLGATGKWKRGALQGGYVFGEELLPVTFFKLPISALILDNLQDFSGYICINHMSLYPSPPISQARCKL
jgi:hypothetical protein